MENNEIAEKLCEMIQQLIVVCNDNLHILEDKFGSSVYIDNFREDILNTVK